MNETFRAKLQNAVEEHKSLVCVGLDPDPTLMPVPADETVQFCRNIIEATADLVCAFKPNIAFFEALGRPGIDALVDILAIIPDEVPVIIDAKRGDIGNSAAAYGHFLFDVLGADAATVNPYGGTDAVEPFLEYEDRGIIVWCRSSNPSALDFQDLEVDDKGKARDAAKKSFTRNSKFINGKVIETSRPYIWWNGRPVRGFPKTFPKGQNPDLFGTNPGQKPDELNDAMREYLDADGEIQL